MKFIKSKVFILFSIFIIGLIILLIMLLSKPPFPKYFYNNSIYSPNDNGFAGTPIENLLETRDFYENKKLDTINYLLKVYPRSQDSLKTMNSLQIASFYNSLTSYYKNDIPYQPQGIFYNTIKNNILFRDIWYPDSLKNRWTFWKYPNKWYYSGAKDWIEVLEIPRDPQSPGFWFQATVGSGIFFNVGTTLVAMNKIDALFKLIIEISNSSDYQTKLRLYELFDSADPYHVIFSFLAYCGKAQNYPEYINTYIDKKLVCQLKDEKQTTTIFYNETVNIQKLLNISQENSPTKNGIKTVIDYIRNLRFPESNVILEHFKNAVEFSNGKILDEIIYSLGHEFSGYQTIQFLNNNYNYEILDLRIPEKYEFTSLGYFRQYSWIFDNWPSQNVTYKPEVIQEFFNMYQKKGIITKRDPFDLYNENKINVINIFQK